MLDLERRSAPRIELQADAKLALNGDTWNGKALNASLEGLYMVFPATVPVTSNQPIQLGLVSEVGVLEINGRVLGLREAAGSSTNQPGVPPLGIAVKYAPLGTIERQILESILDGAREHALPISFMGLLIPQETGDLLLEVNAPGGSATDLAPIYPSSSPSPPEAEDAAPPERRLTSRGKLSIPILIEHQHPSSPSLNLTAQTVDLSLGGMSLRLETRPDLLAGPLVLRLSLPHNPAGRLPQASIPNASLPAGAEDAMESTLTAEVVWKMVDPEPAEERTQACLSRTFRVGLRLTYLNDAIRLKIAGLVAQLLTAPEQIEQDGTSRTLVSESLDCRNPLDQRIALYYDHRRDELPPGTPVIIISPGYGETKKEHVALAYYLAANGFHVLRYDHSNHVGESDGEIQHSTLSSMRQDLTAMLDFAEQTWPASPLAVITTSLAGRVALKAVSQEHRVKLLVLLTGVVDVQATLLAVHQEDLIGDHVHGIRRGVINMLGFNIDADGWLADAVKAGYADLRTTIKDAEQVTTPVALFCAEHDAWVGLESVKTVHAALRSDRKHLYVIPEALHRLNENPRKARAVFRQVVACCSEYFVDASSVQEVRQPAQREIGLQSRLERERARAQNQMAKIENVQFWQDYLEHFHYIANVSDFWQLLDHVYRLLGTLAANDRILDAGCGNGNFGMFLMVNQAYSRRHTDPSTPLAFGYVGTDFVFDALTQARRNLANLAAESIASPVHPMTKPTTASAALALSDLNLPLPFIDSQFTCVVSNLVIGYLQDPLFTLRELMRVLSPNGRLVITNLKPQADLSQIYRNFVHLTEQEEELEEGRKLLHNSSKIKQGESDGIFRFFNRQDLATLLTCSGAQQPRIYSTFGNQAFIAVATKPSAAQVSHAARDHRQLEPFSHV
ncbi:MAG: methyltransferase domain-containing protein [Nitrospirae bacterium]|nr:MAG: methyltransferase domain-containing protein [Nitrospirota bacterium]